MKMKQAKGRKELEEAAASMGDRFPSTRYFQVHFEYLESLLIETRDCLDALKRQVAAVNQEGSGFEAGPRALRKPQLGLSTDGSGGLRGHGHSTEEEQWEGF